jgi:hypothetical protein
MEPVPDKNIIAAVSCLPSVSLQTSSLPASENAVVPALHAAFPQ